MRIWFVITRLMPTNKVIVQLTTSERRIRVAGKPIRRWKSSILNERGPHRPSVSNNKMNGVNQIFEKPNRGSILLQLRFWRCELVWLLNSLIDNFKMTWFTLILPHRSLLCFQKHMIGHGSLQYEGSAFSKDKLDLNIISPRSPILVRSAGVSSGVNFIDHFRNSKIHELLRFPSSNRSEPGGRPLLFLSFTPWLDISRLGNLSPFMGGIAEAGRGGYILLV